MQKLLSLMLLAALTVLGCNPSPAPQPAAVDAAAPIVDAAPPIAHVLDEVEAPSVPKVDTRTPTQKAADDLRNAQNACRGSDGVWRCPKLAQPHLMAASGNATAAQCGPACTVSNWFIDPQNATTCASDANSCTSATCAGSGIGPCLTYQQIVTRLGSTQAVYPYGQSATIFELSAQTANVDVIFGEYRMSGGGQSI